MTALFEYPKAARFGRMVPKSRIFGHTKTNAKLKQLFVDQVDKITWAYKLAPETINLSATKTVAEIQVFEIALRTPELDERVLRAIDKAIAFPILFELTHGGKRKMIAAYKRPNEADSAKWVVSDYFSGKWEPVDSPRKPLPTALDFGALYDKLLGSLIDDEADADQPIAKRVERAEVIAAKKREIARIQARLKREKQFNIRVQINGELREAQAEFEHMKKPGQNG